jgi:CheY-like chemotaxis protein
MMPQMDGMETTKKLRKLGYSAPIVALTANALAGNDKMFMQNGFDGFIPKPIDIRQLNDTLNTFVRDRHPDEAKKYKPETVQHTESPAIDPKLLQVFRSDAKKAVVTLHKAVADGDYKLLTITAHAMKSALANVGESEASALALALEKAGRKGDTGRIASGMERLIKTLNVLLEKFSPAETGITDDSGTVEDTVYLKEQLAVIKAACEVYDDDAAYAALNRLKETQWKANTAEALEQIRDALFIYSDFDGAADMITGLLEEVLP